MSAQGVETDKGRIPGARLAEGNVTSVIRAKKGKAERKKKKRGDSYWRGVKKEGVARKVQGPGGGGPRRKEDRNPSLGALLQVLREDK